LNQFTVEILKNRLKPIIHEKEPNSDWAHRAAVVLLLNSLEKGISLLLVRRAVRITDPWSGQMAFPGGYMTSQDTCVLDTAIRETREEVGINLIEHELLGTINDVSSTTRILIVTPFVALLRNRVDVMLHKDEIAEAAWIPVSDLLMRPLTKQYIKTTEGELEVDSILYHDQVIWGLTLRMIEDFLSRIS